MRDCSLFGENRVQEFSAKVAALADLHDADWHMIGHLQTNKAAKTVELFHAVDSVDSLKLAEKLDASARKLGKEVECAHRNQRWRRSREERRSL